MKIKIPPSEGKTKLKSTGPIFSETNFRFEREVGQIVRLLELIDNEDLKSIYGTSQEKSELFHRQNEDIFKSKCAPAIERYTGVVYEHLKWETLKDTAKEYMEKHVLIFSGLFGMTTPLTMIPNYKLKMNVLSLQYHWNHTLTNDADAGATGNSTGSFAWGLGFNWGGLTADMTVDSGLFQDPIGAVTGYDDGGLTNHTVTLTYSF